MTVIHVQTPKGAMFNQGSIAGLVDMVGKNNLVAVFGGYEIDPAQAEQIAKDIWGDVSSESVIWGAEKSYDNKLTFKRKVLDHVKKTYDRKFEEGAASVKALTSVNTTVFIPTIIAPEVVDIVAKKMPFLAIVQKKPMTSSTMVITRRATDTISSISFSADNAASLTPIDQTYTKITITAKLLFVAGQVSHFVQAASQETIDLLAQEIQDHFIDMQGFKEKAMIACETAVGGTWAGHFTDTNGYNGIIKEIETNAASNFKALSNQSINLSHVDWIAENISANNGEVAAYICDRSTFTSLRSRAKDFKRYQENDINIGFPDWNFSIDGVPVFWSNFMSRATNEKAIFGFDLNAVEYRELLPDTYFEVAQDLSPSKKFFFEHFGTFVVTAPEQCSCVVNGA